MRDRPIDPSALVDAETRGELDDDEVIERWRELEDDQDG